MKIVQIDSARFGIITVDSPIRLNAGLNLWVSQNQAGKSTFMKFVEWMLYGPEPGRGGRDTSIIRRYTPWAGGQPTGRIVIRPELAGWPEEVLISARFSDYFVQVTEYRTQKPVDQRIIVNKAGEWNLGQMLLNLGRQSFRQSLLATHGTLIDPLRRGNLRQTLTSDLGTLVENPDLTTVDRIQKDLEAPRFVMAGSEPRTIRQHEVLIEKEVDIIELERRKLQQQVDEFRESFTERDSLRTELGQLDHMINNLDLQTNQLELAKNYYLLRVAGGTDQASADEIVASHPEYLNITPELEREVESISGQLEAIEHELRRNEAEMDRLRDQLHTEQARLGSADAFGDMPNVHMLREVAKGVRSAHNDYERALANCTDLAAKIPAKDRERYSDLDSVFAAQRDNLSSIIEWQKQQSDVNMRLAELREKRADLQILSRVKLPPIFYIGLTLIPVAILLWLYIDYKLSPAGLGWIGGAVCFGVLLIAALLTSPVWRQRASSSPAALQLKNEVNPEIEKLQEELGAQDRRRRRFIELYNIDRTMWDRLVENILEYSQLGLSMREFQAAQRDRDTIKRRLEAAWLDVGQILPLAPVNADLDWLERQILQLGSESPLAISLEQLESRLEKYREDVERLRQQRDQYSRLVAEKLQPVGLQSQVQGGLNTAISAFRRIADQVRMLKQAEERQAIIEQSTVAMAMSREKFEQAWATLTKGEQTRIAALANSRTNFESVCSRLQEIVTARRESEQQREKLRKRNDELRDELERFGRIDREAEAISNRSEQVEKLKVQLKRWDEALKMTSRIVDSLVTVASQDAAPEIDRALRKILSVAPIRGVRDLRLGKQLDLHLQLDGAPADIPGDEIWNYLSTGAQQQLGLAVRLAMARTASGRTNLPLLLDEPLSELDDERAKMVFNYIEQLAEDTQIILTSCHERTSRWLVERGSSHALMGFGATQTQSAQAS